MVESLPGELIPNDPQELRELIDRAKKGDKSTLPALQELVKDREFVENMGGNLAKQIQLSIIRRASGTNLVLEESLRKKMEFLQEDLEGAESTPLENLLIERIVTCWLRLRYAEILEAQSPESSEQKPSYRQRQIDSYHKQYLSAIKTLATVRKLAVPILIGQVNIGTRQVNKAIVEN